MNPISTDELSRRFGTRFDLVVLAAKRAGQLKNGNPPLIDTTSRNPLTIALEEIAAGKILLKDATEEMLCEPEPVVQDYLVRRGSLQDQIATYALVDDEEEEFEEDELEEEIESPFGEEYDEEEAEFEFGFGDEPDQIFPEELEEEAEELEDEYLSEEEEEEEVEEVEEEEEES